MSDPEGRLSLRSDDLVWRVVEDDVVALDFASSKYFATNRTGTFLWERLRTGATRTELVRAMCDRYSIDPQQARREVDSFVSQLASSGLLE
jgi:Coenzyme PQQ synthesis protein D (PqqD)